ncbi:MAG: hypothetical protein CSA81_11240 [Acidobacteria bacterium]|nr:MAG: hypothetical protein CSA81_11240 [Acidobacteriota bacterium]
MGQVAQALSFIHARNLVHQDIKPANILIDGKGNAFLGDFGLAFKYMTDSLKQNLTRSSRPGGTTYFMSPEQQQAVFRRVKSDVSAASDIYAFGLTLYTLLSGEFVQIFPKPLSTFMDNKPLADRLDKLLRRCWESDPKKRFKNGSELLAAWPSTAGATPPPPPKQAVRKGELALSTSHDAEIYLDGKGRGSTKGCFLLLRDIPYGEHRLKAENRTQMAGKTFNQDDELVEVSLELKAKTGRLKVLSEIGYFNFSVMGASYKAPKVIKNVSVGEHELKISYKELKFSRKVCVEANKSTEFLFTQEMLKQEKQRADEKAIANLLAAAPDTLEGKTKLLSELQSLAPKVGIATQPQLKQTMEHLKKEMSELKRMQLTEEKRRQMESLSLACQQALEAAEGSLSEKQEKHEKLVKSHTSLPPSPMKQIVGQEISRLEQAIERSQKRRKKRLAILSLLLLFTFVLIVSFVAVILQKKRADDQAWYKAQFFHTIGSYQSYIEKKGKAGAHYIEALSNKEELEERDHEAYAEADKAGTEEALREYMANYELHVEEAKSRLSKLQVNRGKEKRRDEEARRRAKASDTLTSHQSYVKEQGTKGAYYRKAKAKPKDLRAESRNQQSELQAGSRKSFTILGTSVRLNMRWIPSGSFTMGSPKSEGGDSDEKSQHRVTLSKGFWMLETEVTQEMWEALMGTNPSYFKGAKRPVERVSWYDAKKFIEELNNKGIGTYRLPTEAEWEYACRAGSSSAYCYGDRESRLKDYAWYGEDSGTGTHEVGGKQSNDWGLYDMHGNVWEWCEDWYKKDYPVSPQTDPRGPASGEDRVNRGSSYWGPARVCRSANRNWFTPDDRYGNLGFRLARNYP